MSDFWMRKVVVLDSRTIIGKVIVVTTVAEVVVVVDGAVVEATTMLEVAMEDMPEVALGEGAALLVGAVVEMEVVVDLVVDVGLLVVAEVELGLQQIPVEEVAEIITTAPVTR
jgi:hypothetical protein